MYVLIYILAICLANLSASYFGVWVTPINAFVLIGLELVVRDILHHRLNKMQMFLVVAAAGVLSFLINRDTQNIALASCLSVIISCFVDYFVYEKTNGEWFKKSNTSNFFSGLVDSITFPLVAFGVFMPEISAAQWAAKFFGGFLWLLILNKFKVLNKCIN